MSILTANSPDVKRNPRDNWPAWTDADTCELGPDVEPEDTRDHVVAFNPEPVATAGPALAMADWIASKASEVRSLDSDLASWLAAQIDELATTCRVLSASTPDEFDGRAEVMAESSWNLTPSQWEARVRHDDEQEAAHLQRVASGFWTADDYARASHGH